MSDLESALRAAVAWPEADMQPDWDDVLRRAGVHHRARSIRARRAGLAAGAAIAAIVLTVPAFGVGQRLKDLVVGTKRPGLVLGATLRRADGSRAGTFSLRTSRLFVEIGRRGRPEPRVLSPPRLRPLNRIVVTWRLDLPGSEQATRVRIVGTGGAAGSRQVAVACDPCSGRTSGRLRLTRSAFSSLLRGRSSVSVSTRQGRLGGPIRLDSLRRR